MVTSELCPHPPPPQNNDVGSGKRDGVSGEGGGGAEAEEEKMDVFEMFQLVIVNSYGTQEVKKLAKTDRPLRLTSEGGGREKWREGGGVEGGSEGWTGEGEVEGGRRGGGRE